MARYIPSMPFQDGYGSVGDVTFYHRDGKTFVKDRQRPTFPGTPAQLSQQEVHHRAIMAWQSLSSGVQKQWNAISPAVIVHRPPFDGTTHMSGYNLFVSAYHGFATLGMEHVPVPVPWIDFPAIVLEEVESVWVEGDDLKFRMRAFMEETGMANTCRCLMRAQLVPPGRGKDPGKMRNTLSVEAGMPGRCRFTFCIRDYVQACGHDLPDYTLHCRYMLLDFRTGYRNQWKPASFLVSLQDSRIENP